MPKVQILVGLPASGKSTFARSRAAEGAIIMSDDAVVELAHAGRPELYREALKPLYKSVETHVVTAALSAGLDVVIDRGTNVSRRGRRRWVGLATAFDVADIEAVVFPRHGIDTHAARRFAHDARGMSMGEWVACVRRLLDAWECPSLHEGLTAVEWFDSSRVSEA